MAMSVVRPNPPVIGPILRRRGWEASLSRSVRLNFHHSQVHVLPAASLVAMHGNQVLAGLKRSHAGCIQVASEMAGLITARAGCCHSVDKDLRVLVMVQP